MVLGGQGYFVHVDLCTINPSSCETPPFHSYLCTTVFPYSVKIFRDTRHPKTVFDAPGK